MMRNALGGFVPAIVTPFDTRGEMELQGFETIVRWFLEIGANGIVIAGDNGESWALSADDRRRLLSLARQIVGGRVPLLLGASASTTQQAIQYAEVAAEENADAILVMAQTYVLKATRAELVAHFARLAKSVEIPIVLYNSPRRAGISMTVDDIAAVCDAAPVVALKESSRELPHLTHVIQRLSSRIAVMTGPAPFILIGAALGAKGFISSGPELYGKTASRLMGIGRAAPTDEYRSLHNGLTTLYGALMSHGTWPASLKAALNLIGLPAGVPREPVAPLPREDTERLRALLGELGIESIGRGA